MLRLTRLFIWFIVAFQNLISMGPISWKPDSTLIHTTKSGTQILVRKGKKPQSPFDFRVTFIDHGKRERTPTHVHMIVEMYVKHAFNPKLTLELKDHIVKMFYQIHQIYYYPPKLQFFRPEHAANFEQLNRVGEFSVEFILMVTELIMIQEKTNYPKGSLTQKLYNDFGVKDRFSVVSAAVFRG